MSVASGQKQRPSVFRIAVHFFSSTFDPDLTRSSGTHDCPSVHEAFSNALENDPSALEGTHRPFVPFVPVHTGTALGSAPGMACEDVQLEAPVSVLALAFSPPPPFDAGDWSVWGPKSGAVQATHPSARKRIG